MQLIALPKANTTAGQYSLPGVYKIAVTGAEAANYNLEYKDGMLTVLEGYQDLVIPNAFTPNNDGINDTWEIKYLNTYPRATVSVFNRNGQRVYFSNGYISSWDGNLNGQKLPAGVYYYIIAPNSRKALSSGHVTIVR